MPYVYRHIRLDKNEPFYIGIGSDTYYKRANNKTRRNKIWKDIVSKSNYEVEILFDNLTWEEACEKEKEFILLYGRKDIGTGILSNLTDGGEGILGNKRTQDFINKRSGKNHHYYNKGYLIAGEKNPMFGKSKSSFFYGKFGKDNPSSIEVFQYLKDGITLVEKYGSTMDAERKTGINHSHISKCCKNKYKSAGGYVWSYIKLN
jgi:hypothetical protein